MTNSPANDSTCPCVSVLVTTFNREAYLADTIKSILDSTYQDFEIIVVDDESSDHSLEVAKQYADQDKRVRVYSNERNLGDYPNRNRAASLARGKYLKYLDADDLIYRHGLAVMVEAMERFPQAALALSANVIDPVQPYPILYSPSQLYSSHYLGRSPLGVGPSASIIRRECFAAVGGFSGKQFVGDSELWLKLAERWAIASLPPALVWWRQHEQQQMNLELSRPDVIAVRYKLELDMLEFSQHLSEDQKAQARNYLTHLHARRLWSLVLKGKRLKVATKLMKESAMSTRELLTGLTKPARRE